MSTAGAEGYVKLWRSIKDWEWYDDVPVRTLFLHLLVSVNREPKTWRGETIAAGEMITSLSKLAEENSTTKASIVRYVTKLTNSGTIETRTNNQWTVVTIVKWGDWQGSETRTVRKRYANDHTSDTTKIERPYPTKEGKNKEGKNTPLSPDGSVSIRDQFLSLWETYERHGVRKTAAEYWAKLTNDDRKEIIEKAPAYVASTSGDRLQFRKHLEGWINPEKRLWERPVVMRADAAVMTKAKADEQLRELRTKLGRAPGALVEYGEMPRDLYEFYKANP